MGTGALVLDVRSASREVPDPGHWPETGFWEITPQKSASILKTSSKETAGPCPTFLLARDLAKRISRDRICLGTKRVLIPES